MNKKSCVRAIESIAAVNKLESLLCSHFVVELIVSAAVVDSIGEATTVTVSAIVSLMMALLMGLAIMFDDKGNWRRSTSFDAISTGLVVTFKIGDLERLRLSRFDVLSVDDFGDDLLFSYDDFRGDFELSFVDAPDDLLLLLPFPAYAAKIKQSEKKTVSKSVWLF